jgi:hypothetical protein
MQSRDQWSRSGARRDHWSRLYTCDKPRPNDYHIPTVARYEIPQNVGKVRVAMYLGGKFAVWNGKQGEHEFRIVCKTRKQAVEVAGKINRREHDGAIEVLG